MKIAIDISQVVYEGTGVARFTKGLIESIVDFDSKNEWIFFFSSLRRSLPGEIKRMIEKKQYRLIRYPVPPTLLALVWNKLGIVSLEQIMPELDWFISSDWTEPPASIIKKATIVHDLTYLRFPETVTRNIRDTQASRLNRVKLGSNLIFSDSQITKNDLIKLLGIDAKKIIVNYPGVTVFHPSQKNIQEALSNLKLKKPFIFSVGKTEPRKNYQRLITAFNQIHTKSVELVIVGPKGWDELNNTTMKQYENIKFLGLVSDKELYSLYSSCLFFVFPSLWEGFGYPLIEAMQLGAAVACSHTSSLKELGENNAFLFDPLRTESIAQAMNKLISDKSLRDDLIKKGLQYAKSFTWKNYYYKMITALENY